MICVLLGFFDASSGEKGDLGVIALTIRTVLLILCPNIAIKRAVFNLKLQSTPVCVGLINLLFQCKFSFLKYIKNQNK